MKPALFKSIPIVIIFARVFISGGVALAAPEEKKVAKEAKPPIGAGYEALVLGPDGYYWGTTRAGGDSDLGTIYKVKADGADWHRVWSFTKNDSNHEGYVPFAGLMSDGTGYLWGTTHAGGANRCGTIFKVEVATGALRTVSDGINTGTSNKWSGPQAGLVSDGRGCFWGTSEFGGASNQGTVFKVNAITGVVTTVVEFTANAATNKGSRPHAALVMDGIGGFWGTTMFGGKGDYGTVFKVDATTGLLTTLVEFTLEGSSTPGANPIAGLCPDGHGFMWGTAEQGGKKSYGTVFKINVSTGAFATVVDFTGKEAPQKGRCPRGGLVSDDAGCLWGTTAEGGISGVGTVFKINATTGEFTTLVEFAETGDHNRGECPRAALVSDGHGSLLGTTARGGPQNYGTVFKIDIATGVLTTLVEFGKVGP